MMGPKWVEGCLEVIALCAVPWYIGFTNADRIWIESCEIGKCSFFFDSRLEFAVDVLKDVAIAVVVDKGVSAGWNQGWRFRGWKW